MVTAVDPDGPAAEQGFATGTSSSTSAAKPSPMPVTCARRSSTPRRKASIKC